MWLEMGLYHEVKVSGSTMVRTEECRLWYHISSGTLFFCCNCEYELKYFSRSMRGIRIHPLPKQA